MSISIAQVTMAIKIICVRMLFIISLKCGE